MRTLTSVERIEAQARRRQQIAFCVLTIVVIAVLLVLHTYFASLLGKPSTQIIAMLGIVLMALAGEWFWLVRKYEGISEKAAQIITAVSIAVIFLLTAVLAWLTDRDEVPYFTLPAIAILQCAYRFRLWHTGVTIAASIAMIFGWTQYFYTAHPPPRPTEFLEVGMISVIYCLMGLLVWYLVNQLEAKQRKLYRYMEELDSTRRKLLIEEKLGGVGRLASGIAHEIRNPVAMIASSLSTAKDPLIDLPEREEMFAIAAREARRLERLTVDFLTYARPSPPQSVLVPILDILEHVAATTKLCARERSIEVRLNLLDDAELEIDTSQVESALINLALNAVDATPDGGIVTFRTRIEGRVMEIEVENSGSAITEAHLLKIFEPFFTTKPAGTGLGLATARTVARSHGGDLRVSKNQDGAVAFLLVLPLPTIVQKDRETSHGQGSRNR